MLGLTSFYQRTPTSKLGLDSTDVRFKVKVSSIQPIYSMKVNLYDVLEGKNRIGVKLQRAKFWFESVDG